MVKNRFAPLIHGKRNPGRFVSRARVSPVQSVPQFLQVREPFADWC